MIPDDVSRGTGILTALNFVPRGIREALVSDEDFCKSAGLVSDSVLLIGGSDASFRRSIFFGAIREGSADDATSPEIVDEAGRTWRLLRDSNRDDHLISLTHKETTLGVPDAFLLLDSDVDLRARGLRNENCRVNLSQISNTDWDELAKRGPLSDSQMSRFLDDAVETPVSRYNRLVDSLRGGSSKLSILVPKSTIYYERLIGPRNGAESIQDWVSKTGQDFSDQLTSWRPDHGLKQLLLRSFHPALVPTLGNLKITDKELRDVYEWLCENGDLISQVGAIEAALGYLNELPELAQYIVRLLDVVFPSDEAAAESRYQFLSSSFALVDSELARVGLFRSSPTYWSRCAALAQAAMIERAAQDAQVPMSDFAGFCMNQGGQLFYLNTLADLRVAPFWSAEFASWEQLRQECLGRVLATASRVEEEIKEETLRIRLIDAKRSDLWALNNPVRAVMPGPLEGKVVALMDMPDDVQQSIEAKFEETSPRSESFIGIVNSCLLFNLSPSTIMSAVDALKRCERLVDSDGSVDLLVPVLAGLAQVAATQRNASLANEVLSSLRRHRIMYRSELKAQEVMWIALTACAAWEDLDNWCEKVGDVLTELSFSDLDSSDAVWLTSSLDWLLTIEPKLWATCSKAKAASASIA